MIGISKKLSISGDMAAKIFYINTKFLVILFVLFNSLGCSSVQIKKSENSLQAMAQELALVSTKLKKKTIAIVPFSVGATISNEYSDYIAEKLTYEVVRTGRLLVVERTKLNKILKEQQLAQKGIVDWRTAAKIGRLLSVEGVVIGSIHRQGDKIEIFARVVHSQSGLILSSVTASYKVPQNNLTNNQITYQNSSNTNSRSVSFGTDSNQRIINDEKKAGAKIFAVNFKKSGASIYISGLIKNTGNVALKKETITFTLLNQANQQVGVTSAYLPRYVKVGETLPFSGFLKPVPNGFHHYKIFFEATPEDNFFYYTKFKTTNEKFQRNSIFGYRLVGTIQNLQSFTVSYPQIIISLFDNKNQFIGVAKGYASFKKLRPSASSPFSVTIYKYGLKGKPKRYTLHFAAMQSHD